MNKENNSTDLKKTTWQQRREANPELCDCIDFDHECLTNCPYDIPKGLSDLDNPRVGITVKRRKKLTAFRDQMALVKKLRENQDKRLDELMILVEILREQETILNELKDRDLED